MSNKAKPVQQLDYDCVNSFVLYKAFDVISEGGYKKLMVKSKENGEPWAIALHTKIQKVSTTIKSVLHQVNSLHEYDKDKLQHVCQETLSHVNPPCKIKTCWN
eukprot:3936992-Rhodomonas_salina.2